MEMSTVTDDAEKAKERRTGFYLKEFALGSWIDMQMSKEKMQS